MANERRVRGNFVSGTLNGALTNVATSMTAANLANLPVVDTTNHAVITIENEIVYVTAHTAGATTATILRGQEGTSAVAHNNSVAWAHGLVASDDVGILGYASSTTTQTGFSAVVDVTGCSAAVTIPFAQHRIRVTGRVEVGSPSVNNNVVLLVVDVTAGNVEVGRAACVLNTGLEATLTAMTLVVPAAGARTYKLTVQTNTGTANTTNIAASPNYILVEDLGPFV